MAEFKGQHTVPDDARFGIVVARFNAFITERLLDGCRRTLIERGAAGDRIDVAWVPGSFEIPTVARRMAECGRYDAVICIGCVIRGGTPHFEYVAETVRQGVARAGYDSGRPVIFGVLTTDTVRQAFERAGVRGDAKAGGAADPKGAAEDLTDEMKRILAEGSAEPALESANKGVDAALAAIETVNLMRQLPREGIGG